MLKVKHIIIVGHSGCGGVNAALKDLRIGLADNWIRHVQDVRNRHRPWLDTVPADRRVDALCELNVVEQALNVCQTTIVQDAWQRGQEVVVHGWVYGLHNGLLTTPIPPHFFWEDTDPNGTLPGNEDPFPFDDGQWQGGFQERAFYLTTSTVTTVPEPSVLIEKTPLTGAIHDHHTSAPIEDDKVITPIGLTIALSTLGGLVYIVFFFGIFFPILWIFGAFVKPTSVQPA
jgi:hypothetical protein